MIIKHTDAITTVFPGQRCNYIKDTADRSFTAIQGWEGVLTVNKVLLEDGKLVAIKKPLRFKNVKIFGFFIHHTLMTYLVDNVDIPHITVGKYCELCNLCAGNHRGAPGTLFELRVDCLTVVEVMKTVNLQSFPVYKGDNKVLAFLGEYSHKEGRDIYADKRFDKYLRRIL